MTLSLYDAIIPGYLQIIGAVDHLLDKAEAHCADGKASETELLEWRLIEDMLPFSYQVKSVAEHSIGAIEAVRAGNFSPSLAPPPDSFEALRTKIADARAALQALEPAEVDSFVGQDMAFSFGEMTIPFAAEGFLLSMAQPNFYFHATTAYDILRANGIQIGKRDFLGELRVKAG